MIRTAVLALALAIPLPAVASEWMGSLNFTKGAPIGVTSAKWKASINSGSGTFKVKGTALRYNVQKSNSFFIVSDRKGGGVVGTGIVHKGKVAGTFKVGRTFAGSFDGTRTSKSGKGKK